MTSLKPFIAKMYFYWINSAKTKGSSSFYHLSTPQTVLTKLTMLLHRIEYVLLFPDENFAQSYEKLTNLTDVFSSAFHTIL
jgi:hypothetical protein